MNYFPLFMDLRGQPVLLVGAGGVAERKARLLLGAGAEVRVVARELNGQFDAWLLGWTGDYDSADNFIGTFFGNLQVNDFHTKVTDYGKQLSTDLAKADGTVDEAERTAAYEKLNEQIMMEYLPGLAISHSPPALVVGPKVEGVVPSPLLSTWY